MARVIKSDDVFQGKVFSVRIDHIERPAGDPQQVEIVVHHGAVVIIPIDDEGRIWFVRQYRHPAAENLLELPAGTLKAGEDPEACAVRESREEIGMLPGILDHLGGTYVAPGYSTEYIHYFLARKLTPSPLPPDQDEELVVERLSWDEVQAYMSQAMIRDAKTLAGILLAGISLGHVSLSTSRDQT